MLAVVHGLPVPLPGRIFGHLIQSMDLADHVVLVPVPLNLHMQLHAGFQLIQIHRGVRSKIHRHGRPLPGINGVVCQREHPVFDHDAFNTGAD